MRARDPQKLAAVKAEVEAMLARVHAPIVLTKRTPSRLKCSVMAVGRAPLTALRLAE